MSYDKNNRGQIWPNKRKEKDTHPDFQGTLNVEGVEYWLSAWKRPADANPAAPSLTFSIKLKEQRQPKDYPQNKQYDPKDDLPF